MPKGDAFERKVRKCTLYGNGSCVPQLIHIDDAAKLLRAQHRAYVKIVRDAFKEGKAVYMTGAQASENVLRRLNARAK